MHVKQLHGMAHKLGRASLLEVKRFHCSVRCGCQKNCMVLRKISGTLQTTELRPMSIVKQPGAITGFNHPLIQRILLVDLFFRVTLYDTACD